MKIYSTGSRSLKRKLLKLTVFGLNALASMLALPLLLLSLPVLYLSWLTARLASTLDILSNTLDE